MIKLFDDLLLLKKEIRSIEIENEIDSILELDLPFFRSEKNLTVLYLPLYTEINQKILMIANKKNIFFYPKQNNFNKDKNHKSLLKEKHGESTLVIFSSLKMALKNYSEQFQKIRSKMNELDINPVLDRVEIAGRELRKLTDLMEGLLELIIVVKERNIDEFDISLISFDYDLLNTETRYWLERCRSHMYRIASLRTKCEMQANKQLNDTMSRLTVIMAFLTIVGIVVSVPGTVGAIFGIPALSDAYFRPNTTLLVFVLVGATMLSIALGYLYWKSLGFVYVKPR